MEARLIGREERERERERKRERERERERETLSAQYQVISVQEKYFFFKKQVSCRGRGGMPWDSLPHIFHLSCLFS